MAAIILLVNWAPVVVPIPTATITFIYLSNILKEDWASIELATRTKQQMKTQPWSIVGINIQIAKF